MLDVTYTTVYFFVKKNEFNNIEGLKIINPSLGRQMLTTQLLVPSPSVFVVYRDIVSSQQLTAPADRFGSERIHVDGQRITDETASSGDKA